MLAHSVQSKCILVSYTPYSMPPDSPTNVDAVSDYDTSVESSSHVELSESARGI